MRFLLMALCSHFPTSRMLLSQQTKSQYWKPFLSTGQGPPGQFYVPTPDDKLSLNSQYLPENTQDLYRNTTTGKKSSYHHAYPDCQRAHFGTTLEATRTDTALYFDQQLVEIMVQNQQHSSDSDTLDEIPGPIPEDNRPTTTTDDLPGHHPDKNPGPTPDGLLGHNPEESTTSDTHDPGNSSSTEISNSNIVYTNEAIYIGLLAL